VRPNKSLSEVDPKSVRKKLKDKSFARSVVREDIWKGIEEVGVDIDVHMSFVVEALKPLAAQIGVNP
jgi:predicted hydrolase (HD superfamily)